MKKPTQCHLWQSENLKSEDLYNAFEVLETFVDDSHLSRWLVRCKECGQLYFKEFYEEIDWKEGNDPHYVTYIPVETNDEIETLKKARVLGLLQFSPCLRKDFPVTADQPEVYWVGKEYVYGIRTKGHL